MSLISDHILKIDEAKCKLENGQTVLDVPILQDNELPFVSIITTTKDRKHLFPVAIYNWKSFIYPKNKLEWIIVDDSKDDSLKEIPELKEELKYDLRIKYIHLKNILPIADKRNFACKQAKYEYIMNMDDDDYYFKDNILAKVRVIRHFNRDCVYSYPLGIYDKISGNSAIYDTFYTGINVPEATMLYKKSFWKKNKYGCEKGKNLGESYNMFKENDSSLVVKIPFIFNMIAITHKNNVTGNSKKIVYDKNHKKDTTGRINSLYKYMDRDFKKLMNNLP